MAQFIRSDLEFILEQIRIAEAHAAGTPLQQLIANPTLSLGLRTVDGSYNNLVQGQSEFGAADTLFPRMTTPEFRDAEDGHVVRADSGIVYDSQPRTISNLIVDQIEQQPRGRRRRRWHDGDDDDFIPNVTPDVGLSAPFNSWFTLFGQFFDHGLDLVTKGGSGTVFVPLQPDDPLYVDRRPSPTRTSWCSPGRPTSPAPTASSAPPTTSTSTPTPPRRSSTRTRPTPRTPRTRCSCASTCSTDGKPVATGGCSRTATPARRRLLHRRRRQIGGLATWAVVKAQAAMLLGIELSDTDVTNVPLLATDPYGNFLPGAERLPAARDVGQLAGRGQPRPPRSAPPAPCAPATPSSTTSRTRGASPNGSAWTPTTDARRRQRRHPAGTYDDELLDAHFITGDGRGNENIGLTAVHHVFHSEHDRLVEHIQDVVLATNDLAFLDRVAAPRDRAGRRSRPHRRDRRAGVERRAPLPGGPVRHRDAVPAPRVRGVRPQGPAGDQPSSTPTSPTSTRRSSPSSPTRSTASATRC